MWERWIDTGLYNRVYAQHHDLRFTVETATLKIICKNGVCARFWHDLKRHLTRHYDKLDMVVIDLKILKQIEDEIAAKEVEKAVEKALKEN